MTLPDWKVSEERLREMDIVVDVPAEYYDSFAISWMTVRELRDLLSDVATAKARIADLLSDAANREK